MNPPWILCPIFILWMGLLAEAGDLDLPETNTTAKERPQREIIERERRLIPYMTFYLAHTIRNPNSGERQNILIPIQAQQANLDQIHGVPQVQTNNIRNLAQPQRYETPVTQPVTARFQDNGFYPTPSIELTPNDNYKSRGDVPVLEQVYRFKPSPRIPQKQQQQQLASQPLIRTVYQQQPQRVNQPQIVKITPYNPNYSPTQYIVATQTPQHSYTSAKLQNLANNQYLQEQNYYKGSTRTVVDAGYIPGKVYAVNIIPQGPPKIAIQRLRPRPTQEKTNHLYIATTTPTPYRTQVKFELEDARIPNIVNGLQLEKVREPATIPYPTEAISKNYNGKQGQITESPKKEEPNVYYPHEIRQDNPSHVTFVPIQVTPPPLTPETIRIEQVAPIQSTPVAQIDQIGIIQQVNTPRPQIHETNDISQTSQGVEYHEYDGGKVPAPEAKPSLDNSVVNLLTILKQTNQLPQNFTPENIDNSIRTLALILERLQNEKKFQSLSTPPKVKSKPKPTTVIVTQGKQKELHNYPNHSGTSTPGRPGIDYPTYATIPQTSFDCATQRYKGFFGDPDTNCQVWHYCDLNGGQASFLCPNGTIFSQVALTCDWWFNVKCATTSQLYVLNERLYKYILPFSPSFPEDYSGPLVDRYLAAKFKEMEAKQRLKALKALISTPKSETNESSSSSSSTQSADTTPVYNEETN